MHFKEQSSSKNSVEVTINQSGIDKNTQKQILDDSCRMSHIQKRET